MDKGMQPTPETTLIVLLGASEWPRWPDLDASKAFSRSAKGVKQYFLEDFHLPQANLLDLFDADHNADDIDDLIDQFLHRHIKSTKTPTQKIRDVLIFFIGHAGFTEASLEYYLAVRRTRKNNPELSGLPMASLARTLRKHTRDVRLMLILDCCFAAAAFKALHFQGGRVEEAAKIQIYEAFKDSHLHSDASPLLYPRKGIALLCASSSDRPALFDTQYTEFSEALLQSLASGVVEKPGNMSLRTVGVLVQKSLSKERKKTKPELHSPDQREGDIAEMPFFPNPQTRLPLIPSQVPPPPGRRTQVFIIVLCLILLLTGGSTTWLKLAQLQQQAALVHDATTTAVSFSPLASATALAATRAYWTGVERNGVQLGFDAAHTGWNPYERVLNVANVKNVKQLWSFATGGPIDSSPAVANGMVYIGSEDHRLYAFDGSCHRDCQPLWSFATGGPIDSSPAVANGMVYIGSEDHRLYAFDVTCSQGCSPLWSFQTGDYIYTSPVVANGMVYIGSSNGNLYAFDGFCRRNCQPLWYFQTGLESPLPTVTKSMLYVYSNGVFLNAFDATCRKRCRPVWSYQTPNGGETLLSAANGMFYGGIFDVFYAFDDSCRRDCQPIWSFPTLGPIFAPPALANGRVYLIHSENGQLAVFDGSCRRDCQPLWSFTTGSRVYSSPTVANGVVYINSQNGKLYAFDGFCRRDCHPLWSFTMRGPIDSSPTVANGMIYIGSDDGKLYAFGLIGTS